MTAVDISVASPRELSPASILAHVSRSSKPMSCFAPQCAAARNFLFSAAGRGCRLVDMKVEEYKPVVKAVVFEEETFLKLTLSKKLRDDGTPWVRVSVRPVLVRGRNKNCACHISEPDHLQ